MTRYLAWIDTPLNNQIEMVEHLKYAGVLVPVEVPEMVECRNPECRALIEVEITGVGGETPNDCPIEREHACKRPCF